MTKQWNPGNIQQMKQQIFIALCICFGLHACAQKAAHDTPEAFLARLKKGLTSDSPTYFEENLHLSKTEARRLYFIFQPDMRWIEREPENERGQVHIDHFWEENLGPYRRQFRHLWGREGAEARKYFQKFEFENIQIDTTMYEKAPLDMNNHGQFALISADFRSPEDGQLCKFQAPVFRFHGERWKLYARFVSFGNCW